MKKAGRAPKARRLIAGGIFALTAAIIVCTILYAYASSRFIAIERTTLLLEDLPPAFEGKTILFLSDIDMVGLSGPAGMKSLFRKLAKLKPDMLILGGDYANFSIWDRINSTGDNLELEEKRRELFSSLADFSAPLGKFAVQGENDLSDNLAAEMSLGGISLLQNGLVRAQSGSDALCIAGLSGSANCAALASQFKRSDCVIAIVHNPADISGLITSEAGDSGAWCDVILSGHTHWGQINLFGRTAIATSELERRYANGWSKESGIHILVSPGVGCEGVNLRLGTQAQAHLITLSAK